jgi:hypothetical protein
MHRKLRRSLVWFLAIQVAAWIIGLIVGQRLSRGDEQADEFRVAALCWGKRFECHANHLRSGSVLVSMGGVDLDLRGATLDPAGATIDVKNVMGGVTITVPEEWAVMFDSSAWAGGVETKLSGADRRAADAPTLHVRAAVLMGGVMVTTESHG